ncbi:MAG TPA: DUF2793 domain-containing protein [Azoarcus taiwanensis]|nr:DUF2793 domain-containing protein [Rhodocyclaceae bacterium]HRQ59608.1 DUF2793 domain-containing protein [Azoarcus taiwanensis]
MGVQTEPLSGLEYDWPLGYPQAQQASGDWKTGMDANLLAIGQQAMPVYVLSRSITAPPGGESSGDVYIPADSATGAWAGHDGELAVWDGAAWVFIAPRLGRVVVIDDEASITAYLSAGWAAGVPLNPGP